MCIVSRLLSEQPGETMQEGRRSACPIPGGRAPVGGWIANITAARFVQCVARAQCQIPALVVVVVSSTSSLSLHTPDLYLSLSSCLSPRLPASAATAQSLHFPRAGRISNECRTALNPSVQFIQPARLQAPAQAS